MIARLIAAWVLSVGLLIAGFALPAYSQQRKPDIVFVPAPSALSVTRTIEVTPSLDNVRELHFNGDWTGVKLCRANTCVRYEEVFSAKRN